MKNKNFDKNKKVVFDACQKALNDFGSGIVTSNFSSGVIEAEKNGDLLSYGHKISISITRGRDKTKIIVSSNSIGIQLIDWGTNSKNEDELMELITTILR